MTLKYGGNIVKTAWSHMDQDCMQGKGTLTLQIQFTVSAEIISQIVNQIIDRKLVNNNFWTFFN